jgi:hypothetical protein
LLRSALAQGRGAVVEQNRVDPLHPSRVLGPQIVIGLQQRPALQDVTRRDPALRLPALGQQHPQMPAVDLVGLGVPLAAVGSGGVGRLGQMHRDAAVHPDARLSWGGLPAPGRGLSSVRPDACHLIWQLDRQFDCLNWVPNGRFCAARLSWVTDPG